MSEPVEHGARRIYGRRRGHRLSARKQKLLETLLPAVSIDLERPAPTPLAELFGGVVSDVWLEIGFGAGEHLAWQADRHCNIGFLGCEPFVNGVAAMLAQIEERSLQNVRIYNDDARDVLAWLPRGAIGRIFILFPDPWPKKRHRRRRLVSLEVHDGLARVLRRGGELRMASDIGDYARAMLLAISAHSAFEWTANRPADWRDRPSDWPRTRYEAKARAAGRRLYLLAFRRR